MVKGKGLSEKESTHGCAHRAGDRSSVKVRTARATTHFILATLAFVTEIADSAGFEGDPIPRFQVGHFCTNFFRNIRCHSV